MKNACGLTLAVILVAVVLTTGCGREAETGVTPSFEALDRNQDGKLTRDELPKQIADSIMAADADGDGMVTQAELEAAGQKLVGPGSDAGIEPEIAPEMEEAAKPEAEAPPEESPKPQADAKTEKSAKPQAAAKPETSTKPAAKPKAETAAKTASSAKPQVAKTAGGAGAESGNRPGGRAEARGGPGGEGRPSPGQMFAHLDKNQDGKLTKDELPERMGDRIMAADSNGDGAVTQAELQAARERMGGRRGPDAQGRGGGEGRPDPAQLFTRLDKNNDGKLTKDELPEWMTERLMAGDTNGDGVITKAEFEAAREKMGGQRRQRNESRGNNQD